MSPSTAQVPRVPTILHMIKIISKKHVVRIKLSTPWYHWNLLQDSLNTFTPYFGWPMSWIMSSKSYLRLHNCVDSNQTAFQFGENLACKHWCLQSHFPFRFVLASLIYMKYIIVSKSDFHIVLMNFAVYIHFSISRSLLHVLLLSKVQGINGQRNILLVITYQFIHYHYLRDLTDFTGKPSYFSRRFKKNHFPF